MEIEVAGELFLTDADHRLLDLHSILNILNILIGELVLLSNNSSHPDEMAESIDLAQFLAENLTDFGVSTRLASQLEEVARQFEDELAVLFKHHPELIQDTATQESIENIRSVVTILRPRIQEMRSSLNFANTWMSHPLPTLQQSFAQFFAAVEKNSKGRYRIIQNSADQESNDYVVALDIQPGPDGYVLMPPVFQDVLRDLIANARKYTAPGGSITARLVDNGYGIRITVEDTGRGIPPEEMTKVVEFGYRASNVRDLSTKGAGFGLTKAYAAVKQFGGRMWIKSELNIGTCVTIEVPRA